MRPRPLGDQGEAAAARFLKSLGYKIVARGDRSGMGEIDIVAVDLRDPRGRTVVFVEVKTRRSSDKGDPIEVVGEEKQRRLTPLALAYLKRHGLLEYPARFDIVGVLWPEEQRRPTITHIKNAFEAVGVGQMFS